MIRVDLPNVPHGFSCHITTANCSLMQVGFLSVIPDPCDKLFHCEDSSLQFRGSPQKQLSHMMIPVFSGEGMFHTVADILVSEPDIFADIYGMLGGFQYAKILLYCIGHYVNRSGANRSRGLQEVNLSSHWKSLLQVDYRSMLDMMMIV